MSIANLLNKNDFNINANSLTLETPLQLNNIPSTIGSTSGGITLNSSFGVLQITLNSIPANTLFQQPVNNNTIINGANTIIQTNIISMVSPYIPVILLSCTGTTTGMNLNFYNSTATPTGVMAILIYYQVIGIAFQ
jgi:hypothetical protein